MEQIYYTQCPIGYGLGASNGFQIKRLTPGYPVSTDFRHLGMRPFLGGTRTLAPPVLRYRCEGVEAEIARLTPRPREFETERGLWGRPGGHFAHGIRLPRAALTAIANWPAGLLDSPCWRRSDPEPTHGRPPDPVTLDASDLFAPPAFARIAPLAGDDPGLLAQLLTAVALAVREGRTLFLIDEPERLGQRIAALTFAFPEALRVDLTFSTYHDRPEDLPGFRLSGTAPAARPNRAALLPQGIVADLTAGACEPALTPARWAQTLAGWLTRRTKDDEAAWTAMNRRVTPAAAGAAWDDDWLDRLIDFHAAVAPDANAPPAEDPAAWMALDDLIHWAGRAGLGHEWVRARPPAWWRSVAPSGFALSEARAALTTQAALSESWRAGDPAAIAQEWGRALADWLAGLDSASRRETVAAWLRLVPEPARPAFVTALIEGLPPAAAEESLESLRAGGRVDRAVLLPLEARAAVGPALEHRDAGPLRRVLRESIAAPATALVAILDTLAAEAFRRQVPPAVLAPWLVQVFDATDRLGRSDVLVWGLRQGVAAQEWLAPSLRRSFAHPYNQEAWRRIRDRTPDGLRPLLAQAVLNIARDPALPDEAFRWGVEELLLALEEPDRPRDPAWPDHYLRATPSDLDLMKRLYSSQYPRAFRRNLWTWLQQARDRSELTPEQGTRLDRCRGFYQVLQGGNARALLETPLPAVPAEHRGPLLDQLLTVLVDGSLDQVEMVLDSCRGEWAGGFDAGRPGLEGLGRALARPLRPWRSEPETWLANLLRVLDCLAVTDPTAPGRGFEPDSLAAEIVAATWCPGKGDATPEADRWRLRNSLFRDDRAWRILAADLRRDLAGSPEHGLAVIRRWDAALERSPEHPERFFELVLNVCDGELLRRAVAAFIDELLTLDDLPWWESDPAHDRPDDLRERFARLVPLTPLPEEALSLVRRWMGRPPRPREPADIPTPEPAPELSLIPLGDEPASRPATRDLLPLSPLARARWLCLDALSSLGRSGTDGEGRMGLVLGWIGTLPLDQLDEEDRYQFLAQTIFHLDFSEDLANQRLAQWLHRAGIVSPERIKLWPEELAGIDAPDASAARVKLAGDLWAEIRQLNKETTPQRSRTRNVTLPPSRVSDSP